MACSWTPFLVCAGGSQSWTLYSCQNDAADQSILRSLEVKYKTVQGWMQDISKCRSFSDLPEKAQEYVRLIESTVGVPGAVRGVDEAIDAAHSCAVRWIGVGAERDAIIRL
jgi:hypothetical protein